MSIHLLINGLKLFILTVFIYLLVKAVTFSLQNKMQHSNQNKINLILEVNTSIYNKYGEN